MRLVDDSIKLRIIEELEFYYMFYDKKDSVFETHVIEDSNWLDSVITFINKNNIGLIDYKNECIPDRYYHEIIKEIDKTGHKILIRSSNAYDSKFGFHPLTNISLWQNHSMPDSNVYNGDEHTSVFIKPFSPWKFKDLGINDKQTEYILSVRRETPIRNSLFQNISNTNRKWNCIVRYSKYDEKNLKALSDAKTSDIISDFEISFITFIVETIYKGMYDTNLNYSINLTEKTLMAFHTKSIPLFFGCKNLVKSLKNMGFYTFDDIFNLEIDDIDTFDEIRIYKYTNSLLYVDGLSWSEIKQTYSELFSKIQHNYELVNYLFDLNNVMRQKHQVIKEFKSKIFG